MKQKIPFLPQNLKTIEHNGDSLNNDYTDAPR